MLSLKRESGPLSSKSVLRMAPQQAALRLLLRTGSFDKSGTFFGKERAASVVAAKDGGVRGAPGAGGDYLLNYIDNLIVLWINDDHLATHDKEQVGLDLRHFGGHIRGHGMEGD